MRSAFDITGPIMIGPSSSHTAGATRIGLMARTVLGEEPVEAEIQLYGSFAETYRGHGTDRALIAGIMGFAPDDERIREALDIAKAKGIKFEFIKVDLEDAHPNTAIIYLTGKSGTTVSIQGASIGGGNIKITNLNGYPVELNGKYTCLITIHQDIPGIVNGVTAELAKFNINIGEMKVSRREKGADALMVIQVDDDVSPKALKACEKIIGISKVIKVNPI